MQLAELQALNFDAIKDQLCIVAAGHPMQRIGEEMQCLSEAFQARAIFHLLQGLDVAAFSSNLRRGVYARRFFLRKSRQQASADRIFTALSRTDAVFDCIVGGDWPLAIDIHRLSPPEWQPEGEYEEDFCYHSLVHALVAAAVNRSGIEAAGAWRDRLAAVVDGIPSSELDVIRVDLCTAFLAGDEPRFWTVFEQFVALTGDAADAVPLADGRLFEFPWLAADRYVSIELLAWITLARQWSFTPPQRDYRRCPSAAWLDGAPAAEPDLFLDMERQFGL
ncbi:MAG: hypothetical protein QM736_28355 [Vicinamibacterales bacterium]